MSRFVRYWLTKPLLPGILLAAIVLRALVPAGFMPAADGSFALQICKVGFPGSIETRESLLQGSADTDGAGQSLPHADSADHCWFGSTPATALIPALPAASAALSPVIVSETPPVSFVLALQRFRVQQPRAPPAFA